MHQIDFTGLAARLLDQARTLLPAWLPGGKFRGQEFVVGNLAGEPGESLSVNLRTGKWADFADDSLKGGDLVALYAAIHRLGQGEAAKALGAEVARLPPAPPAAPAPEREIGPPPTDAPAPSFKHSRFGPATRTWAYRDPTGRVLGYVSRHDPEGARKQIVPWTWDRIEQRWRNWSFPTPRPLYGLELLAARPAAPVMVVEGEKAADAARELAGHAYVVVTWPGGGAAVSRADWTPLFGRKVLLWPDRDLQDYPKTHEKAGQRMPYDEQPGTVAMRAVAAKLHDQVPELKLLDVTDVSVDGWDAADALAEGWAWPQLRTWATARVKLYQPAEVVDLASERAARGKAPAGEAPVSKYGVWEELDLELNAQGSPVANVSNVLRVFERHPELAGILHFDEFHQKYLHREGREWSDIDELNLAAWMQRHCRFRSASSLLVHQAAMIYAHQRVTNAPRDWLDTLTWDGIERIAHFFSDCFGAIDNDYTRAAARNFWISMAARIYSPGAKVDNMVVLEGAQGLRKSSALAVIGGDWFTEAHESVTSKEFYMATQGKLLIEIAELDAFSRVEVNTIKKVVSCPVDRYRAPYARATQDYPRRCVFVGTTNEDAYLRDPTGGRRFWPVKCHEIRLDLIEDNRTQLFAEAVAAFKAGARWWEMPAEATRLEQEQRRQVDEWEAVVSEWLEGRTAVQVRDVLTDALDIEIAKQDYVTQRRAAAVLKVLGWKRGPTWNGRQTVWMWQKGGLEL